MVLESVVLMNHWRSNIEIIADMPRVGESGAEKTVCHGGIWEVYYDETN